jgi:hypothetical protein
VCVFVRTRKHTNEARQQQEPANLRARTSTQTSTCREHRARAHGGKDIAVQAARTLDIADVNNAAAGGVLPNCVARVVSGAARAPCGGLVQGD